ncbi:hypothetical protein JCGZ_01904 [Jatropha curcas]|uniref:Uncharacterized protein n=1 Tax=Jatropha curcas TaxID=180498 RepID=A0A067L0X0_JATCU|nr:hypothetical protein JCGZ_01904 [Jatropha curcas]
MSRYCFFPADQNYYECLDDLGVRDVANQCLFHAINANSINYAHIKKLKGKVTELEVKKMELEDTLKSLDAIMTEQASL